MDSHLYLRDIDHVLFGALSPDEIRAISACELTTPTIRGNENTEGTPYDLSLGTLAYRGDCATCGEGYKNCPGHFAHIELEEPVYNPVYMNVILGIMKCICIKCFQPRISESTAGVFLTQKRNNRFKAYRKKAEVLKQCLMCKAQFPQFYIDKTQIKMYYKDKKHSIPLSAREMYTCLVQISSETMKLIGFNEGIPLIEDGKHIHEVRPESFIFTVLPVLPTCARPWVIRGSDRKDDDITDRYNSILKINDKLRNDTNRFGVIKSRGRKKGTKFSEIDKKKAIEDLTMNIWALVDNSKEKPKNGARQQKGIADRLKGKEGHCQNNIGGKRVNYTARAVIVGGGSLLPMGWIGVPEHVAKTLTFPELVLDWNIVDFEKMMSEGKIKTVCRQGVNIFVSQVTHNGKIPFTWKGKIGLQKYDIVHRQTKNGDWGIFNRQPTLRIESMQGVQILILPPEELVFRVPVGMSRAFNFDYDGDEMNLHIPQSQGARIECSTISRTAFQLISAQNNAPIMGCVQNALICMYIVTETFSTPDMSKSDSTGKFPDGTDAYETLIDIEDFMAAVEVAGISEKRFHDLKQRAKDNGYKDYIINDSFALQIPGKLAASIVFPSNFTWSRKTSTNEKLHTVYIQNGIILPSSGPLCKKVIGGSNSSALHPLWKISPDTATNLISEIQFISTVLITRLGFSMGVSDCLPTRDNEIKSKVIESLIKCEMINSSDKDIMEKEMGINGALNEAMAIGPNLAKTSMNKGDRNSLVIMKKSGAKGSDMNNGQISAFVGPQNIDGKRITLTLSNGTRALPHFQPGDNSPDARGFVKHSYLNGLTYTEAWFHAAAGRRGVVDTALKSVTWETKIIIETLQDPKSLDPKLSVIEIGKWIDNLMDIYQNLVTKENDRETLILKQEVFIPTMDLYGNVTWGNITAVTRHAPTATLYKITTKTGASVTVTDTKSVLIWINNKFEQTFVKYISKGNCMPLTLYLRESPGKSYRESVFPIRGKCWKLNDVILDEIISIETISEQDLAHQYVYDLTVPSTTNFGLANGLHVVDTADKPRQTRVLA